MKLNQFSIIKTLSGLFMKLCGYLTEKTIQGNEYTTMCVLRMCRNRGTVIFQDALYWVMLWKWYLISIQLRIIYFVLFPTISYCGTLDATFSKFSETRNTTLYITFYDRNTKHAVGFKSKRWYFTTIRFLERKFSSEWSTNQLLVFQVVFRKALFHDFCYLIS